jgi:hypothetical protein
MTGTAILEPKIVSPRSPTMFNNKPQHEVQIIDAPESSRATRSRDRVVARLRSLAKYSAGWDGERADAPRAAAIEDAINFVANLGLDPDFSAGLEPDGAVDLTLGYDNTRLILVFEGDGKAQFYVTSPNEPVSHTEFPIPLFIGNGLDIEQALQSFD